MINCIIIEDEPLAAEKIEHFISKMPALKLMGIFDSAIQAIEYLKNHPVDIIFLDIEMKDFSGIQFLESVRIEAKIIITSAYEQYAIKGFDLQVCDYLLKPILFDRFIKAVEKASDELRQKNDHKGVNKIFVKTEYRLEGIEIADILYIEGMGDYRRIVTPTKKIMTLQSFSELHDLLPKDLFCRVHHSFIVSINKIEKIERNRILIKERLIPVSNSYSKAFFDKLF